MTQAEQRTAKRFDLRLPIELVKMGATPIDTNTETRNMSSGGVMFLSGSQLPVGEPIEYFITLPTGGKEIGTVRLHCMGTVIRLEARPKRTTKDPGLPFNVAATLERYEFIRAEH
ncbi:MAG: PilZ domain-containing protein [Acidobacteriia bacterium]|nr:PilZ domain-containing protein [Terriglobia bacterium]